MEKLKVSEILTEGAKMIVVEINLANDPALEKLFIETKERQEELNKLKEVDEEQLKMVVQL